MQKLSSLFKRLKQSASEPSLPDDIEKWYKAAIRLAKEAGQIAKNATSNVQDIKNKERYGELVSKTDKDIEELFTTNLKKQFPEHRFISEERTNPGVPLELTSAPTWIIDPIDGTMNFFHGFPSVAISVALSFKREILLGIVYCVSLDQMYTAMKRRGSFCNGKPIQVSGQKQLTKAILIFETSHVRSTYYMNHVITNYKNVAFLAQGIRSLGSISTNMCCVASGGADCFYDYSVHGWEFAAGKIIVEEAGGVVMDPVGGEINLLGHRVLCASSQELADSISNRLSHEIVPILHT